MQCIHMCTVDRRRHHGGNGQIVAVVYISIFNFSHAQIPPVGVRIEFSYRQSVIVECDDLIPSTWVGAGSDDDFKDDVPAGLLR